MLLDKISSKFQFRIKDRVNTGNILGEALKDIIKDEKERRDNTIVLGIPRGGVVVADICAKKLHSEFDIIIPRKLRAPHNEEVAIGAVMEDGYTYTNDEIVRTLDVSNEYIEKEKATQIQEIKRRSEAYRNNIHNLVSLESRVKSKENVVLVDDGAATGATIIAAARWIKKNFSSKKLIICVPVVPRQTRDLLRRECDNVETITVPSDSSFKSVGQYYQNFQPVEDEQVIQIMKEIDSTGS
jgi:predicted phosphoribosyltransferase